MIRSSDPYPAVPTDSTQQKWVEATWPDLVRPRWISPGLARSTSHGPRSRALHRRVACGRRWTHSTAAAMKRFLGLLCFACVVASSSPGFAQSTPSLGFSPAPASSWTANRSLALPHPLPAPSLPAVPPGASAPAPSRAPAIALASLGLLGLGVGSTLGYLALDEKAKAEDHCSDAQRLCATVLATPPTERAVPIRR